MSEAKIKRDIQLQLTADPHVRLFNNPTGVFWQGEVVSQSRDTIVLRNPRRVNVGLIKGGSDLIGWRSLLITAEMVGARIAQFVGIETKSLRGRATAEQLNFIDVLNRAGGAAGVARSTEDAEHILINGEPRGWEQS